MQDDPYWSKQDMMTAWILPHRYQIGLAQSSIAKSQLETVSIGHHLVPIRWWCQSPDDSHLIMVTWIKQGEPFLSSQDSLQHSSRLTWHMELGLYTIVQSDPSHLAARINSRSRRSNDNSFLSSQCFPILSSRTDFVFSEITKQSSMYNNIYS